VAVYRKKFGTEQTISDCYDYSALQTFLMGYSQREHIDLLETISTEVLNFCFRDDRVAAAEVRVTKPDVFSGFGTPAVSAIVTRETWIKNQQ